MLFNLFGQAEGGTGITAVPHRVTLGIPLIHEEGLSTTILEFSTFQMKYHLDHDHHQFRQVDVVTSLGPHLQHSEAGEQVLVHTTVEVVVEDTDHPL